MPWTLITKWVVIFLKMARWKESCGTLKTNTLLVLRKWFGKGFPRKNISTVTTGQHLLHLLDEVQKLRPSWVNLQVPKPLRATPLRQKIKRFSTTPYSSHSLFTYFNTIFT